MKKTLTIIATLLAISLIHGTAQTQVLSPGLSEILNNTGYDADSSVSVVIFLNSDQPERIAPAVSETNRHERIVVSWDG